MLSVKLFGFCALICLVQAQDPPATIEQAAQFARELERAVQIKLNEALPANKDVNEAGQDVMNTFKSGLETCERKLKADRKFDEYFKCCSEIKVWAMASIGELAGKHWAAASGAARPRLFW